MFFADKLHEARPAGGGARRDRLHRRSATVARRPTGAGRPRWPAARSARSNANLADFREVAEREREHLGGAHRKVAPAPVVRVRSCRATCTNLAGLEALGAHLFRRGGGARRRELAVWPAG